MELTATGRQYAEAEVGVALVSATIFTEGRGEADNKKAAEIIVTEITTQYKAEFDNLKDATLSIERIRCVDGNGVMSVEHKCVFEIHQKGIDLLSSLSVLESICNSMENQARLTGWETKVSYTSRVIAISKAIEGAYKDAEFEVICAAKAVGDSKHKVKSVSVKNWDTAEGSNIVVLPDFSSGGRDTIFNRLSEVVPLKVRYCREVTIVATV